MPFKKISFSYSGFSNFMKVFLFLVVGITSVIAKYFGESIQSDCLNIIVVSSVGLAILVALDKLLDEIQRKHGSEISMLDDIRKQQDQLKNEFREATIDVSKTITEQHNNIVGIIINLESCLRSSFKSHEVFSSTKTRLKPHEIRKTWTSMIRHTGQEFVAINYLSYQAWKSYNADKLVELLGVNIALFNIHVRRLFVVDTIEEIFSWKNVFDLHVTSEIKIKVILRSDYLKIREHISETDPQFSEVDGFNIIDPENPGFVLNWRYTEKREMKYADLLRGPEIALRYFDYFNAVWKDTEDQIKNLTTPPIRPLNSGNIVSINQK